MHKLFIAFLSLLLLYSCSNSETSPGNEEKKNGENKVPVPDHDYSGCYIRVLQRDTLVAHLQQNGKDFKGKLTFDNYEKDGSSGTITGKLENGIIKLLYRFQSEGMNSVMEVYFQASDSAIIPGTGDIRNNRDTVFFKDPSDLNFAEKDKLRKTNCDDLPSKYR